MVSINPTRLQGEEEIHLLDSFFIASGMNLSKELFPAAIRMTSKKFEVIIFVSLR